MEPSVGPSSTVLRQYWFYGQSGVKLTASCAYRLSHTTLASAKSKTGIYVQGTNSKVKSARASASNDNVIGRQCRGW